MYCTVIYLKDPHLQRHRFNDHSLLTLQSFNNLNYKVLLGHKRFLEETPFLGTYALKLIV
jgi:hypothetical protein